jgi:hypothetical protein
MDMVGHYGGYLQAISSAVVVNTTTQYEIARPIRQDTPKLGAKRNEVWLVVALHMRQIATIELHSNILPRD